MSFLGHYYVSYTLVWVHLFLGWDHMHTFMHTYTHAPRASMTVLMKVHFKHICTRHGSNRSPSLGLTLSLFTGHVLPPIWGLCDCFLQIVVRKYYNCFLHTRARVSRMHFAFKIFLDSSFSATTALPVVLVPHPWCP